MLELYVNANVNVNINVKLRYCHSTLVMFCGRSRITNPIIHANFSCLVVYCAVQVHSSTFLLNN